MLLLLLLALLLLTLLPLGLALLLRLLLAAFLLGLALTALLFRLPLATFLLSLLLAASLFFFALALSFCLGLCLLLLDGLVDVGQGLKVRTIHHEGGLFHIGDCQVLSTALRAKRESAAVGDFLIRAGKYARIATGGVDSNAAIPRTLDRIDGGCRKIQVIAF